jgi:hypothetical protein
VGGLPRAWLTTGTRKVLMQIKEDGPDVATIEIV